MILPTVLQNRRSRIIIGTSRIISYIIRHALIVSTNAMRDHYVRQLFYVSSVVSRHGRTITINCKIHQTKQRKLRTPPRSNLRITSIHSAPFRHRQIINYFISDFTAFYSFSYICSRNTLKTQHFLLLWQTHRDTLSSRSSYRVSLRTAGAPSSLNP